MAIDAYGYATYKIHLFNPDTNKCKINKSIREAKQTFKKHSQYIFYFFLKASFNLWKVRSAFPQVEKNQFQSQVQL